MSTSAFDREFKKNVVFFEDTRTGFFKKLNEGAVQANFFAPSVQIVKPTINGCFRHTKRVD